MGRKKITEEDFFNRVRNPNYDFSNTNFIDLNTHIEVVCIFHGLFKILPKNMLYKDEGCKFCGSEKMAKSKSLTKQDFIKKAEKLFPNLFDYSLVNYKNNKTKIKIICKKCGKIIDIFPNNFLNGKFNHTCNI